MRGLDDARREHEDCDGDLEVVAVDAASGTATLWCFGCGETGTYKLGGAVASSPPPGPGVAAGADRQAASQAAVAVPSGAFGARYGTHHSLAAGRGKRVRGRVVAAIAFLLLAAAATYLLSRGGDADVSSPQPTQPTQPAPADKPADSGSGATAGASTTTGQPEASGSEGAQAAGEAAQAKGGNGKSGAAGEAPLRILEGPAYTVALPAGWQPANGNDIVSYGEPGSPARVDVLYQRAGNGSPPVSAAAVADLLRSRHPGARVSSPTESGGAIELESTFEGGTERARLLTTPELSVLAIAVLPDGLAADERATADRVADSVKLLQP